MPDYHSRDGVTSRLRLRGLDYASAATCFVTICTERRVCLFGDIDDGAMRLSHAGVMIDSWWHSIGARFSTALVDAAVIMPNHVHGILHIGHDPEASDPIGLADIMHWFKTRTTYDYTIGVKREGWPRFPRRLWQKGYYDRIVRNDRELTNIRAYIEGNPARWPDDEYHAESFGMRRNPRI